MDYDPADPLLKRRKTWAPTRHQEKEWVYEYFIHVRAAEEVVSRTSISMKEIQYGALKVEIKLDAHAAAAAVVETTDNALAAGVDGLVSGISFGNNAAGKERAGDERTSEDNSAGARAESHLATVPVDESSAQYLLDLLPQDLNADTNGTAPEDGNDTADVDGSEGDDNNGDAEEAERSVSTEANDTAGREGGIVAGTARNPKTGRKSDADMKYAAAMKKRIDAVQWSKPHRFAARDEWAKTVEQMDGEKIMEKRKRAKKRWGRELRMEERLYEKLTKQKCKNVRRLGRAVEIARGRDVLPSYATEYFNLCSN